MKELIKKFGAFSIGPMVGAVISFITVPLITYFISPEEYGKTSMFTVAQGMISMFIYLGLDQAFVREYNLAKDKVDQLMTNAIIIPLICVGILDILIILFARTVSAILFDTETEILAVYMLAVMFPFMIIGNFSLLKIRMEEKGIQYSCFLILLKVLILVFTVLLFFMYEKSFRSVVYAMALAEIVNGTILCGFTIKHIKLRIEYLDKTLLANMLKFGIPLVPASILGWLLTSMDKIMLRTMCTYDELGLYTAAFKIVSVLSILQTCFTLFWTPVAYRWYEEKVDKENFEIINNIVAVVMTTMCLCLLLFKNLVAIVLGHNFAAAIFIFPFILLNPIMYTMSESTAVGIGFTRKTHYTILVSALSGGINILLNYLLIPELGGKGAAVATGVSYVVFFWARTLVSRKLWWEFSINRHLIYTVLIILNCTMHTFMTGGTPYLISIISLIIIGIFNIEEIKTISLNLKELKK